MRSTSLPDLFFIFSIIAGAMWGVPLALPIVCASVATGATICYLISQQLGAVLVAMPKWKARVDAWGEVLARHNDNMLSYMIVIRCVAFLFVLYFPGAILTLLSTCQDDAAAPS